MDDILNFCNFMLNTLFLCCDIIYLDIRSCNNVVRFVMYY